MNGKPGQNPMQAFHHSVAQTSSMTACTLLSPLYWAMYSMLCPFTMLGASCRVYLTYRSMSARVHRSENAIGSSTRRLGMFRFSPAGAVGTQQAVDLSSKHIERHVRKRGLRPVDLAQAPHLEGRACLRPARWRH